MSVLTLLVGIPASGKSTLARVMAKKNNAVFISENEIQEELFSDINPRDRNNLLFEAVKSRLVEAMKARQPVIMEATLRARKYRRPYLELARGAGYQTEVIFLNVGLEQALIQNQVRAEQGMRSHTESMIRKYERHLQIPTYAEGYDRVEVRTMEPVNSEAAAFFHANEARLIKDPTRLIRELEQDGRLERWLPELHAAIPIDQHNPHHRFTIYEHIMKATETIAGTSLKMVWTMLLHDIGKAYPGIKQFTGSMLQNYGKWRKKERVIIENGADIREGRDKGDFYVVQGLKIPKELVNTSLNGHFYEHENIGAQLAFNILTRFGYGHDFALEVATLIQFHMLMPREIVTADLAEIRRWYAVAGQYTSDLMLVRLADTRGK